MLAAKTLSPLLFILLSSPILGQEEASLRQYRKELLDPTILAVHDDIYAGRTRLSYVKSVNSSLGTGSVFAVAIEIHAARGVIYRLSCLSNISSAERDVVKLSALDDDRLVLLWSERTYPPKLLRIYVVDVGDCEWRNVTSLTADNGPNARNFERNVLIVPYGRVFDVVFSNFNSCERRLCRITYDFRGTLLNKLTILRNSTQFPPSLVRRAAIQHFLQLSPVSRDQPIKGFFMFAEESDVFDLKTLDFQGEISNFQLADGDPQLQRDEQTFLFSSSHEIFGYCWIVPLNRTIHCRQYDTALNLRSNLTWTIGYFSTKALMHNMPNGGFLILVEDVDYKSYYLMKVEANGRRSQPVELRSYCKPAAIFEASEGGFYCFYGLCWDKINSNVTIDVNCVPDKYFVID